MFNSNAYLQKKWKDKLILTILAENTNIYIYMSDKAGKDLNKDAV